MRPHRAVDIALVIVILFSLTFIAIRLFQGKTRVEQPQAKKSNPAPPPILLANPESRVEQRRQYAAYGVSAQRLQAELNPISDIEWTEIISQPAINQFRKKRAEGCNNPDMPKARARNVFEPTLLSVIQAGQARTMISPGAIVCSNVGDEWTITKVSETAEDPFVSYQGTIVLQDIISGPMNELPESLKRKLGVDASTIATGFGFPITSRTPSTVVTIFRFSPLAKTKPRPSDFVPTFFWYPIRNSAEMKAWLAKGSERFQVIDVRSEEESRLNPIPNAISVPFTLPAELKNPLGKFSWDLRIQDLNRSQFDMPKILDSDVSNKVLILIGANREDGRPLWALRELVTVSKNVQWFLDGANEWNQITATKR